MTIIIKTLFHCQELKREIYLTRSWKEKFNIKRRDSKFKRSNKFIEKFKIETRDDRKVKENLESFYSQNNPDFQNYNFVKKFSKKIIYFENVKTRIEKIKNRQEVGSLEFNRNGLNMSQRITLSLRVILWFVI